MTWFCVASLVCDFLAERNESNKEVQNEVTTPSESMVQTPTKQDLPMEQISTEMTEGMGIEEFALFDREVTHSSLKQEV